MRFLSTTLVLTLVLSACASASVATVDGVEISSQDLDSLHVDVERLDDDDRASSVLLLILHEAFTSRSETDFGLGVDHAAADEAYASRTVRWSGDDAIELGLAARNERPRRLRLEADLDVVRDGITNNLVRTEAAGFDIDLAYHDYLIDNAEVCIQHIQFDDPATYDVAADRLEAGEPFAQVALDLSADPFVSREDGGTGAGGDIGCAAPFALPVGMDDAALEAPVGEAFGPVPSTLGFHLVWVISRVAPPLEAVRPSVIDHAVDRQGPELFRLWAVGVLQSIEVTIAPEYGAWGILPETDPVPTVVTPERLDLILP